MQCSKHLEGMAGSGTEQGEQSWGASFNTLLYSYKHKIKQDFRYPLFLQNMVQGSYYQPKQCTIYGKSLKNYNGFALLDPPKMGNLMTPVQTPVNGRSRAQPSIYIHLRWNAHLSLDFVHKKPALLQIQYSFQVTPKKTGLDLFWLANSWSLSDLSLVILSQNCCHVLLTSSWDKRTTPSSRLFLGFSKSNDVIFACWTSF